MKPELLKFQLVVSTLIGAEIIASMYYKECEVIDRRSKTWVELVKLGRTEYDLVLGMDWLLTHHHAHLDRHQKRVNFKIEKILEFTLKE